MKSKPTFSKIFMLLFLLIHQIAPALSKIVESEVKSFVVKRRMGLFVGDRDIFTVNMKSDLTCAKDVVSWCRSLGGYHESYWTNHSSCSCYCWNYSPNTFLPSIQRCANNKEVVDFGGELSLL